MAQVINTNIASLNAQRNLNTSQGDMYQALQRLSSGLRINTARDDAAGLAISQRFTSQINGMNQAIRNANDGISLTQTAEGGLEEIGNLLQRIRVLAVQSANATNSPSDRQALNNEVRAAVNELDRIARSTQFNGMNVLDGSMPEQIFQVGANRGQTVSIDGVNARANHLGAQVIDGGSLTNVNLADAVAEDLIINGVQIDISGATNMVDIRNAINAMYSATGVEADMAVAVNSAVQELNGLTAGDRYSINLNGVEISFVAGATAADSAASLAAAANGRTDLTGVRVVADGDGVRFTNDSGDQILLADGDDALTDVFAAGSDLGDGATSFSPGISLSARVGADFIITGDAALHLQIDGVAPVDMLMTQVNVLTFEDSQQAIRTVDYALQRVSSIRSELGAIQNRFTSVVSNLQIAAENQTASRSRIMDADFAAETAALTRAQILQQAGISMLAQANALPQNVLSLLQ